MYGFDWANSQGHERKDKIINQKGYNEGINSFVKIRVILRAGWRNACLPKKKITENNK